MMRICVGMITRNSESKLRTIGMSIRDVVKSIFESVPIEEIEAVIVADDSEDDTVRVIEECCREHVGVGRLIVDSGGGTRARARQKVIDIFLRETESEWLFFVDDDVIISRELWIEASQYMSSPDIGLIWGIARPAVFTFMYGLAKSLGKTVDDLLISEFEKRGGTHDTFLRRTAIEGIKIPDELHYFEDWYILKYVTSRGYRYAICRSGCLHYNPGFFNIKKTYVGRETVKYYAYLAVKYGVEKPSIARLLRSIAGLPFNVVGGVCAYGLKNGIKVGIGRWIEKVLYRIYMMKFSRKMRTSREISHTLD